MTFRSERTITVLRAIVHEVRVERIAFMAGSVAYHAFVSLLPLLFLLLAIVSTIGDRRLETSLVELTRRRLRRANEKTRHGIRCSRTLIVTEV